MMLEITIRQESSHEAIQVSIDPVSEHVGLDKTIVPRNWVVTSVGAEFFVQLGKMIDAAKNIGVEKPYIGNRAVQWNSINVNDLPTVALTPVDLQKYRLKYGDLLVCEGGDIGRAAIWHDEVSECYYQKALHRLRPIRGFDSFLMLCFLEYWSATGFLNSFVTKTSIAHLPKEKLILVPLPVPPRTEQRAIAAALSDIDSLIAALNALIAKKRAIKQAAMQHLLTGRTRLPGFAGEWETKRLGEVSKIKTGKKNNEEKVEDGRYPFFVRSQHVESIDTFSFDGEAILVPGEGGIGTIIHYIDGRFDYHQRVYKISNFSDDMVGKFVYFSMMQTFNEQATRNSVKATVDSLRLPTFLEFEFFAPPHEEQLAIAQVLSDMDAEIDALEARVAKTRDIKEGMMQQLLTGRIRLVTPAPEEVPA